jgi:hypothetical protein
MLRHGNDSLRAQSYLLDIHLQFVWGLLQELWKFLKGIY